MCHFHQELQGRLLVGVLTLPTMGVPDPNSGSRGSSEMRPGRPASCLFQPVAWLPRGVSFQRMESQPRNQVRQENTREKVSVSHSPPLLSGETGKSNGASVRSSTGIPAREGWAQDTRVPVHRGLEGCGWCFICEHLTHGSDAVEVQSEAQGGDRGQG